MTPSDDDLSWLLRRELHAEAARLTPAPEGLGQIRGQLGSRSAWHHFTGSLRVDAERYGLHARYLAAEAGDAVLRLLRFASGRSGGERHGSRPAMVWLRPVVALAAVCIFAGTAAAVPGVRHAITNIGSSTTGSTTPVNGSGGGNGAGTGQRINGSGNGGGNSAPGQGSGASLSASPNPSATCTTPAKAVPSVKPSKTKSGKATVKPAVSPATSTPAGTPSDSSTPAPTPSGPTASDTPVPGTSAPVKNSASDSTHLSAARPCQGPTPPGSEGGRFVGRRLPPARGIADADHEPDSGQHAQHRAGHPVQHADHLGQCQQRGGQQRGASNGGQQQRG